MRHFELNSVSADFQNCGLPWARDQVAKLSAHLSNENRNEPLDWKTISLLYEIMEVLWDCLSRFCYRSVMEQQCFHCC